MSRAPETVCRTAELGTRAAADGVAALAERFDDSVGFVTASSLQSQELRILVDEDEELVYGSTNWTS